MTSYDVGCQHEWVGATCTVPTTCSACGKIQTEVLDNHNWTDADCDTPKTCSVCNTTEGEALVHEFVDGKCTKCGVEDPDYVPENPDDEDEPTDPETGEPTDPETVEPTDSETSEPKEEYWLIKLIRAILDFIRNLLGIEMKK